MTTQDPGILVISNMSPSDVVFENDRGSYNVSRAIRDCRAGKHKRWAFDIADAYAHNSNVEIEEDKVAAMVADPNRLANSPPLIGLVEDDGKVFLIDGHHRLRALHRLGHAEGVWHVIEQEDAAPYKILYNGQRK